MPATQPPDPQRTSGLGTVVVAAVVAVVITALVIWYHSLSVLWALLLYPAIGATLTFAFAGLAVLLSKPDNPQPAPKPQSSQGLSRSRLQKPPR